MLKKITDYVGDRKFYQSAFLIAIPIALQSLITISVNLVDNVMLGALGELQLSASALAVQFISLFQICCMGLGMGASVLTSRYWGMKERPLLWKTVTLMLRFTFLIGLAFTVAAALIPDMIIGMYTGEAAVVEQGVRYLKWSVPCFLLMGFSLTCTIVLRSVGEGKIPLIGSCFAFIINIVANWIFIFGNLGAPRMEIEGAALGTLISRCFEFLFICGYFLFVDQKAGYRVKCLFLKCSDLMGTYLTISIPVLISDAILALGNNAVAMVMGRIGATYVAANSIVAVTQQLSTAFIQGVAQAGCIMTGHGLGRRDYEKIRRQSWSFLIVGVTIGICAGGFILAVKNRMISFYNISQETQEIANQLMNAICIVVVFQAANSVITKGVLRGGGDTKSLMIADNIFLWLASIPLGYLAGVYFHWSPFSICIFLKADQFLKLIWCIWRLKSGRWIKEIGQ